MTPVVAVIAPGMMGAAVGKRLVDNGLKVLTSLKGRSQETAARAKAAGMAAASDDEIAARRFHSLDSAAGRRAVAGPAFCAGADSEQRQAGLCRLQRHQSEDGRARRRGDRADRCPVRRCRHHRPAAEAGRCRAALLCVRRRGAALRELRDYGLDIRVLDGAMSAASALKMSYAGITKGTQAIGAAMMLAATRAGSADELFAELQLEPEGNVRLAQAPARR